MIIIYTIQEKKNKNLLTFIPLFRKKIEPKSWPENKKILNVVNENKKGKT